MTPAASIGRTAALMVALLAVTACTSRTPQTMLKDVRCVDFNFPVYFQDASDQVSTVAAQSIAAAVQRTRACRVASLTVSGLGDAALADRRLATVARALAANGLTDPQPISAGTARGPLFMGRRAEVMVHFAGPLPSGQ